MCKSSNLPKSLTAVWSAACAGLFALSLAQGALAEPYQEPLFLVAKVKPITVLNMSRDHQLYFKLYDDFSDITDSNLTVAGGGTNPNYGKEPDGLPDTSYVHGFDYYGYFDSYKCYVYSTASNQFNPVSFTASKYCNAAGVTNQWSGNFLNWASMTRIDAIRKILYGGMRSTDTTAATVLERAYLPTDAHSFAKYYAGADTPQLTPFSANINADPLTTGITICNTSTPGTATFSQAATSGVGARPLLRIARGNYSLWASSERFQCRWRSAISGASQGVNGNNSTLTLINAYSDSPIDAHKLDTGSAAGEYVARVAVCVDGLTAMDVDHDNEKCKTYNDGTAKKPLGVLQQNSGTQNFALLTGSYSKNKSGGVLRKAASLIGDEINANGIFQVPASGNSIIRTLDLLRIYGYRYSDGLYHNNAHTLLTPGSAQVDGCMWRSNSFVDGQCVNWGNPQAEIYLESLRYLSGETSPNYDADDSRYISGLNRVASWTDPVTVSASGNYCAPLSVVQFDASMTSYDADNLTEVPTSIGNIDTATNVIGAAEGIDGRDYFVGENGADNNQLCTPKNITALANVRGSCPGAPRLAGSYKIAGLAYKARSEGVGSGREKVTTYGVSLAASVPNVVVPVPGSAAKITILPACRNITVNPAGNCAIVDFKIVSQNFAAGINSGRLYVNWEDTEQGGDYDQDMWGVIDYEVTATSVRVTTDVVSESTSQRLGFGYIISGTTNDGFHVQSGVGDTGGFVGGDCILCNVNDPAMHKDFTVGVSTGSLLKPALYYAAKWGGYQGDDALTPADIAALGADTYYNAIDPRELEEKLAEILGAIGRTGSSATVASNSTRLEDETYLYQALFNSEDWSGSLKAFELRSNGTVSETAVWDTSETLTAGVARRIYTRNDSGSTVEIDGSWPSVPATMKAALQLSGELNDANAQKRFNWLMGIDHADLRVRTNIMGDIVNSDPAYAGASNQRYDQLPIGYGAGSYEAYVSSKASKYKVVFVGANDGMLHAFRANGPEEELGTELFAYIPRGVYSKLADLSNVNYQHKYTVDGPLYVGDAYIDSDDDGDKEWRTLVGGTLGAGGRGAFLLDVTDTLVAGSTAAPRVVFDLSADDATLPYRNDLGYSTGKMLIVPTANNTWSAIFSNGAESANGTAKLIAVDVDNPSIYKVVDTTAVTDNGLSGVALLPDGNGVSTYAYAGDLKGNMWKFNLTDSVRDNWKVAFPVLGAGPAEPLIKVIDSDGNTQSITATPTLGLNGLKTVEVNGSPVPSVMVYFGTGKYAATADISDSSVQSIYAIADTNEPITLTALARDTELKKKEITSETDGVRVITPDKTPLGTVNYAVDWDTYKGWFLDLKYQNALGERVIAKPLLISDRLILNTFVPSSNQCDYGGSGWLMELTGVGDKFIGLTVLVNNANHQLMDPIIGDLIPIISGEKVFVVGSALGTVEEGSVLESFEGEMGAGTRGRMSWRQLK